MPEMRIMRGLPGCGKTSYVKESFSFYSYCSADRFFERLTEDEDGNAIVKYNFDPTKLGEAHASCLQNVLACIELEKDIVIDNTHVQNWEWMNYLRLGEMASYGIEIVSWPPYTIDYVKACHERNEHGVPLPAMLAMAARWEATPEHIAQQHGERFAWKDNAPYAECKAAVAEELKA